jgi:hypothetical protein
MTARRNQRGYFFHGRSLSQDEISRRLAVQERERAKTHRRIRKLREKASSEIDRLIAFLNASDEYVTTELEDDDDREPVGDEEPSLGSLDRAIDQERLYQGSRWDIDAELDDSDPNEAKDQPLEMWGES